MQSVKARTEKLKAMIESHPDFPKKGILFRDMFPILRDPTAYEELVELLVHRIRSSISDSKVDVVLGLDARGFLVAPSVALKLNAGFVPVRKGGKLPGPTEQVSFDLEYGKDVFEIQKSALRGGQNVMIVDDLIATGGSMSAACQLARKMGCNVLGCLTVIELLELDGKSKLQAPFQSLMQF